MKNTNSKNDIVYYLENLLEKAPKKEVQIIGRILRNFSKEDWSFIAANFGNDQKNRFFNTNIIFTNLISQIAKLPSSTAKANYLLGAISKSGVYLATAKSFLPLKFLTKTNIALIVMAIVSAGSIRILSHVESHLENEINANFTIHGDSKEDLNSALIFVSKLKSVLTIASSGAASSLFMKFFNKKSS